MKVAIITDFINQFGGAELVTNEIAELYPEADIYTLFGSEEVINKFFKNRNVIEHPILKKSKLRRKYYRYLLPFYPTYIEDFDFKDYDLVISSSYLWAKGIITNPDTIHVSYIHTPMRQAWTKYHEYLSHENDIGRLKKIYLRYVMNYLRLWDYTSANRVDYFIANSTVVNERINKIYRKNSTVIYPPVRVKFLRNKYFSDTKSDYYVTVGRLVPYKRVDLLIETFNSYENKKLLIIGDGNDISRLKSLKKSDNIEFLGFIDDHSKNKLVSEAKAFLFAAEEDFGMSPVESLAMGTPIICFGEGGSKDYLIDQINGIEFKKQTVHCLISAIDKFEQSTFDYEKVSNSVQKFDESRFQTDFKNEINNIINP